MHYKAGLREFEAEEGEFSISLPLFLVRYEMCFRLFCFGGSRAIAVPGEKWMHGPIQGGQSASTRVEGKTVATVEGY